MQSFKQYLFENCTHSKISKPEELLKLPNWQEHSGIFSYVDPETGEVYFQGHFDRFNRFNPSNLPDLLTQNLLITCEGKNYIPFVLTKWNKDLTLDVNLDIENFTGFPEKLDGSLTLQSAKIHSMEGFPKEIDWLVVDKTLPITNKLSDYLKKCNKIVFRDIPNYIGLLSLLKIDKLKELNCSWFIQDTPFYNACQIVSKHLKKDRNIVACQEELFKNNLDEYAKL